MLEGVLPSTVGQVLRFVTMVVQIENALGHKAVRNLLPMQAGDVEATFADVSALDKAVGFRPATPIEVGVRRFVEWYRTWDTR